MANPLMVQIQSARRRAVVALATGIALASHGCITEGPPLRPEPRTIPEPTGLSAESIVLSVEPFPLDTNDNQFADTFRVTVFLFPDQNRHPMPIHVEGSLIFTLTDQQEKAIAKWELPPQSVEKARIRPLPGPGYMFTLSLLDVGSDRVFESRADLSCTFIPEVGQPVHARGQTTLRVGPISSRSTR